MLPKGGIHPEGIYKGPEHCDGRAGQTTMECTEWEMDHSAHRTCKQRHEECPGTSRGYGLGMQQV